MGMFEKMAMGALGAISRTVERNGGISGCMNKLAEAGRKEQMRRDMEMVDRANRELRKWK